MDLITVEKGLTTETDVTETTVEAHIEDSEEFVAVKVAKILRVYILPCLLVVGTVGNTLSLVVMTRPSQRGKVTSLILSVLAVVDTMCLYTGLLRQWIRVITGIDVRTLSVASCKLHVFMVFWSSDLAGWLIALIAVDRFISVIFPHSAKQLMTQRRGVVMVVGVIVFLGLINSQLLGIRQLNAIGTSCGHINTYYALHIWPWIDFCLFCIIPFFIILVCNVAIVVRLVYMKARSASERMTSMTLTLMTVSLAFLVCTLPTALYLPLTNLFLNDDPYHLAVFDLWYAVADVMMYTNNAINFFLYCIIGTSFRQQLLSPFCKNRVTPISHLSTTRMTH